MSESKQLFIEQIARMTKDLETVNGQEFIMDCDDAIQTLNQLIDKARALLAE